MRVLVCGTSVMISDLSKPSGEKSWVYYLQQKMDCEFVNISRFGCGNQYIHDAIISEVTERKYDLVITQWTLANRIEFRTNYNLPLEDWNKMGRNPHEEYLQTDWMWAHTPDDVMICDEAAVAKNELFQARFRSHPKYYTNHQTRLTQILSLQATLKMYGVPYVFTFYRKLLRLKQFDAYYNRIDWSNVHDKNLFREAKDAGNWNNERYHPSDRAYRRYADDMYQYLSTKNLTGP